MESDPGLVSRGGSGRDPIPPRFSIGIFTDGVDRGVVVVLGCILTFGDDGDDLDEIHIPEVF